MKNNPRKLSIGLLIALVGFPQISETIYTPALPNVASGLLASASMVEMTLAIYFLGLELLSFFFLTNSFKKIILKIIFLKINDPFHALKL